MTVGRQQGTATEASGWKPHARPPLRHACHRPHAPLAPGAWLKNNTRDAGRRGDPGVGQVTRGIRSPRRPRHRPGMVPGRCRLSRRGVSDVPILRLPVSGLGRGARTPGTRIGAVAFQPSPASSWAGPQVAQGQPRRGSARGAFPPPAGQTAARSHARIRGTPRTGPPPGAMAAESHRRGHRPVPGPARSATARAPEGRRWVTPEASRTGGG